MKKIFMMLLSVLFLIACTSNNEPKNPGSVAKVNVEKSQLYGDWEFKSGVLCQFTGNDGLVNHCIHFMSTGVIRETVITADTSYTYYCNWDLDKDTLIITDIANTTVSKYGIGMIGDYLAIGNGKYITQDKSNTFYQADIIGSWYQLDTIPFIYYNFKDNNDLTVYYTPTGQHEQWPTEAYNYIWQITGNTLMLQRADTCIDTCYIEFVNDRYARWDNILYTKSR